MNTSKLLHSIIVPSILALSIGCESAKLAQVPTEPDKAEMLSLMLPDAVKIQPFTKIKSFDEDEVPDGILVVVRPLDRFGDPVKAVGRFYFELWTYQQASAERKGERMAFWEQTIASEKDIRLFWSRAQMYEFPLAWTQGSKAIAPNQKYLLTASYRTPWDETIEDEYVVDFQTAFETIAGQNRK